MSEKSKDNNTASSKAISGILWRFFERFGAQAVSFIVSIILARTLTPDVYGTVALITVFTTILQVFVDSGMGTALIQKKDSDDIDFSSVFYFNIVMCLSLYLLIWFAAPLISSFYNRQELTPIVRVVSLVIIISGMKNIQQAYVSKKMIFKKFFFSTIGGTLFSAVVGVYMACSGFGVWALVTQQLLNTAIDTLILWLTVKWRPKKVFSLQRLKSLLSFGWKMLVSSILDTVYNNLRSLIIGKMYTSSDLAYYNRGRQFPFMIITNINTSIDSVLLPTMSGVQDDRLRMKSMTRRAIKTSTYIMAPIMMGLAFAGNTVIELILTAKWLPCVPFMRIFCITFMFYPIHTANLNAIKALGRSDLFLKLEIIKKIVGFIALFSTMWFGTMAMAYSLLATSILGQIINSWPNRKLLSYSYLEQLKDILPGILLAVAMGVCIRFIEFLSLPLIITLLIQIILGVLIYILGSMIFHLESFKYLLEILKKYKGKKK